MTTTEYLQEHSLDPEFLKTLGWEWSEEAITIPYYDENGKLLYCKYRNMVGPKFSFDKGNHPALYASYKIKNTQVVVFCEGEADAARLWQEGIPAVTAGGVTALNAEIALPLQDKDVIVLLDNDTAGKDAIKKTCEVLQSVDALPRIATLPKQYKDVCEFFAGGNSSVEFNKVINESMDVDAWEEQSLPPEFAVVSGADILKKEIPKQKWLISRMIPVEGISFLVGYEGTGKSFYALTMANAIATKESWLKTFEVKQKTNVLFLDKENTIAGIQERLLGLSMKGDNLFFLEYSEHFELEGDTDNGFSEFANYLTNFVKKNDIGFVVIDSFVDFMRGNENSSGDTQIFFSAIKKLFPGISVLIIHHAGKPSQGVTRTSSQKARGSSNIQAQAFSSFFIEQIPRRTNEFSIEHTKLRGAQKTKKFKVEMEIHTDLWDKENTSVIGLRYRGEIEDEEDKAAHAEEIILETLGVKPEILKVELQSICIEKGMSVATFNRVIKGLSDGGNLEIVPDPNGGVRKLIRLI